MTLYGRAHWTLHTAHPLIKVLSAELYCQTNKGRKLEISKKYRLFNSACGVLCAFYVQTVRFQRLCTHRVDFEERIRFLLEVLKGREYEVRLLCRQFCRAVEGYLPVFQRWDIPVDLGVWF